MPQTVTSCPLCGGTTSRPFDQRSFRGIQINNRVCTRCGLVFLSPRMNESELASFYEAEYRQLYQGGEGPSQKDLNVQQARAGALLAFAQPHLAQVRRHLDIGCSAGLLLQRFSQAYPSSPTGVEPGTAYREYASGQGLPVYPSLQALEEMQPERFDLISLAHVLEHLPDPANYLAHLRQSLLAPDGRLLLEVPNLYAHDCFEVAHLVSFSRHTLEQTLRKAGYQVVQLRAHGEPRSSLIPLYLTVLAQPAAHVIPASPLPERSPALKRRLGLFHRALLTRLFPKRAWKPGA